MLIWNIKLLQAKMEDSAIASFLDYCGGCKATFVRLINVYWTYLLGVFVSHPGHQSVDRNLCCTTLGALHQFWLFLTPCKILLYSSYTPPYSAHLHSSLGWYMTATPSHVPGHYLLKGQPVKDKCWQWFKIFKWPLDKCHWDLISNRRRRRHV